MYKYILPLIAISTLSACSGGSNDDESDSQNQSGVDESAVELALAATETMKSSIASENSILPIRSASSSNTSYQVLSAAHSSDGLELPIGPTVVESETTSGDCGGSSETTSTITTPDIEGQFFPTSTRIEADYNDYCVGEDNYTITLNGYLNAEFSITETAVSSSYSYDIRYTSTIPFYPSGVIAASESCTRENGQQEVCTVSTNYEHSSGTNYSFSNYSVSGSANSGYNIQGTLTDEIGMEYVIDVENVTQCDDGRIQTGTLEIRSEDDQVIFVEFLSCEEFTITYMGNSETFEQ